LSGFANSLRALVNQDHQQESGAQVGVAMSGGVDSTACALLLREICQVHGFFMNLGQPDYPAQLERVKGITRRMGIPLTVVDLRLAFISEVLDYTAAEYRRGLTPNPCMVCNQKIKFGRLLDSVLGAGMSKLATGHYAKITQDSVGWHLFAGADREKDQSYFLSRLDQHQLARIIFPLGAQKKTETYRFVAEKGFGSFSGKESQDICFLTDSSIGEFVANHGGGEGEPGPVLTLSGEEIGRHLGLHAYTIGQRRGLGIAAAAPLYVVGLDPQRNAVIVGSNTDLLRSDFRLQQLHWLSGRPPAPGDTLTVRLRYSHPGCPALLAVDKRVGAVTLSTPQRAITPGQFAVFYQDEELLGSGIIG
jgi:tRNA-uridine 2-sulfurtransferase